MPYLSSRLLTDKPPNYFSLAHSKLQYEQVSFWPHLSFSKLLRSAFIPPFHSGKCFVRFASYVHQCSGEIARQEFITQEINTEKHLPPTSHPFTLGKCEVKWESGGSGGWVGEEEEEEGEVGRERMTYFCENTWFRIAVCGCESVWMSDW